MSKLVIAVLSILIVVSLLVGGCGRQAAPAPTPTLPPSPKPVITSPPTIAATPVSTPADKPLPKTISITTWPAGTTTYIAALAMGTVLSKYADIKLAVEPQPSPLPGYTRMAKGEVELVYTAANFEYGVYTGTFGNPRDEKVRDLFFTYPSNFALMTRRDSGIKAIPDLRGKKVSCIYPAGRFVEPTMRFLLKEYGMDFDKDIVALKYSTVLEMYENLKERRVDAVFGTALRINLEEQDRSPGGAHIVPLPREKVLAAQKEFPFYFPDTFPRGFAGAAPETVSIFYGLGVSSGANISDELIYTFVKTILEHTDEIRPTHAELVDFTPANFAKYPTIPFHNGAIRYYKEKGLWTNQLDEFQKKMLAIGK
jgi:hypothetical protein